MPSPVEEDFRAGEGGVEAMRSPEAKEVKKSVSSSAGCAEATAMAGLDVGEDMKRCRSWRKRVIGCRSAFVTERR